MRQEKDHELYLTYLRGLRVCHFSSMHEAADWVRSQPASKFYISSKSLVNSIAEILRGENSFNSGSLRDKKILLLYDMYQSFLAEHPESNLSREKICEILVDSPAPRFYIGHESCLKALLRERNKHKLKK